MFINGSMLVNAAIIAIDINQFINSNILLYDWGNTFKNVKLVAGFHTSIEMSSILLFILIIH